MKQEKTARHCAVDMLHRIMDKGEEMSRQFSGHEGFAALEPRDRRFCRLLVSVSLRHIGEIDSLLARYMDKPLAKSPYYVRHCLRLGVSQLLFLQTPVHAAVYDTVELLADSGNKLRGYKGLVNAVLKRVARDGAKDMVDMAKPEINIPGWLWQSWVDTYGEDCAARIADILRQTPPLDISVKNNNEEWSKSLNAMLLPAGSLRLCNYGRVEEIEGFSQGQWWVQDAAAAMPVKLLAAMSGGIEGAKVLDLCAAPGGKTAQLVAMGASVVAVERSQNRVGSLRQNLQRLGMSANVEIVQADIMKWQPQQKYDVIILDAPCSATGTLRRHPDVAFHRRREDVLRLSEIQHNMLERVLQWLLPRGMLLYCTCSLQPEEGEEQINRLLANHRNIGLVPFRAEEIGGCGELLTQRGELRTLPCHWAEQGGMDGFYAACLRLRS